MAQNNSWLFSSVLSTMTQCITLPSFSLFRMSWVGLNATTLLYLCTGRALTFCLHPGAMQGVTELLLLSLVQKKWYFSKAKEQEPFVIFPMRKGSKKQLVSHAHPVMASSHPSVTYKPFATSSQSWAVAKCLCKEHPSVRELPVCCDCNKKMWLLGISPA